MSGVAVDAVREQWLVEDRWWTPKPLQRSYFEVVARRRPQRRRLPRAGGAGHGGALVRAAGVVTDGRLRRASRPLRVLVRRRRLAARGARHPRRRILPIRPSRSPTTTTSAGRWSSPRRAAGSGCGRSWARESRWSPTTPARADAERSISREMFHLTLLVENAAGWRQPLPAVDRGARRDEATPRSRSPPPRAGARLAVRAQRGTRLPVRLRASSGALGGGWAARRAAAGRGVRAPAGSAPSAPERFRVELQRPLWRPTAPATAGWRQLAERLGVACVATGNVHSHDRCRAALQDALVAVRLHTTLEESEPGRRGNTSSALAPPAEMAARFAEHPAAVAETAGSPSACASTSTRSSATATRAPRTPTPTGAGRDLPRAARPPLRRHPRAPRGDAAPGGRAAGDPRARALGLLPAALRPARAGPRGRRRGSRARLGAAPPAPGAGPGLERQLDRLLSDRPLPRRPGAHGLFLGRFLNEEITEMPDIDLDFPRDIREKLIPRVHDRYGASAPRWSRPSPLSLARRGPRPRQGARPAARRVERVAARSPMSYRAATRSSATSPRRSAPERAASPRWRALRGWPARPGDCPATSPSTRAGWCSRPSR